jgi:pre-mRNA cleavage complex 2 protein Pcf11
MTISLLYEIGLPYQSTIDGKRFRTEQQLSKHLDYIFQQKQKSLLSASSRSSSNSNSQERGWYVYDRIWTKEIIMTEDVLSDPSPDRMNTDPTTTAVTNTATTSNTTTSDPNVLYTVVADESRDTCIICNRRFQMYFDHVEGQYKYQNCRNILMRNKDDDEEENDHDVGLDNDEDDNDDHHNVTHSSSSTSSSFQLIHGTCWIGLGQPETISYDQTIYINQ